MFSPKSENPSRSDQSAPPAAFAAFWPRELQLATAVTTLCAGGFSGARIWKISAATGNFALRRWPAQGMTPACLDELTRLLRHIQEWGIAVTPVPILALSGSPGVEFLGHLWHLEPWIDGVADFHANPAQARLDSVLRTLSQWHRLAQEFSLQQQSQQWFQATIAPPIGLVRRWETWDQWLRSTKAMVLQQWERSPARERFPELQQCLNFTVQLEHLTTQTLQPWLNQPVPQHACLRDIWHDHVLWQGDTVVGLIDPGAAHTDHVAADLSRLLGSLVGSNRSAWTAGIAAYGLEGNQEQFWKLLYAYDLSQVVLSAVTWLKWLVWPGRTDGTLLTADIQPVIHARLQRISQRLQEFVNQR